MRYRILVGSLLLLGACTTYTVTTKDGKSVDCNRVEWLDNGQLICFSDASTSGGMKIDNPDQVITK
jgi:hypothetical protein